MSLALAVLTLLVGELLAPTTTPLALAAEPRPTSIQWRACADDSRAECGKISVPLDYTHPSADQVLLGIRRYPATGPKGQRVGVLFYNPGGPGLSATAGLQAFVDGAASELAARFDIVGVDPRGVGESSQLTCTDGAPPTLDFTVMPTNRAQLTQQISVLDPWLRAKCVGSGALLAHLGTVDNARDLNHVRAALGESQVSYYGVSYGAILGLAYAEMFGPTVRTLVFDGAVDRRAFSTPNLRSTSTLWSRLRTPEAASETFWSALALCERVGVGRCPQSEVIRERYRFLVDYLSEQPLDIAGYGSFDLSALENVVVNLLYHFNEYGTDDFQLLFAQIVALADLADSERMVRSAGPGVDLSGLGRMARSPRLVAGVPRADTTGRVALVDSIVCSETAEPTTRSAMIHNATAEELRSPGFGMYWTSSLSACVGWQPTDDELANVVTNRRVDAPLLVLSNDHDPVTGLPGAAEMSKASTHGSLIVVANSWGHAVLDRSNCARVAATQFLISARRPSVRRCAPDEAMFPSP